MQEQSLKLHNRKMAAKKFVQLREEAGEPLFRRM